MGLKITVSGVRGILNDGLNPDVILNMALAFGTFIGEGGRIVIGSDTRPHGRIVKDIAVSALCASGCSVIDLGIAPTPAVAFMVKHLEADGGIIISASHNDIEYNALKLLKKEGLFIDNEDANKIYNIYVNKSFKYASWNKVGKLSGIPGWKEIFVDSALNAFKPYIDLEKIRERDFKVAVDAVCGAGSVVNQIFFEKLGIKSVRYLNHDPEGAFPRKPEPVKENLIDLETELGSFEFDIAFVQDPDADRLGILTPQRLFHSEEITLPLAVKGILKFIDSPVVINIATSSLNDFIIGKRAKIIRTPVGEAHVAAMMKKEHSIIGGEGNGGVIFSPFHIGRDSYAGMILILNTMASSEKSLDKTIDNFPDHYMLKAKIRDKKLSDDFIIGLKEVFFKGKYRFDDGIYYRERELGNGTPSDFWFLIRESNTEPILRVQVEAPNEDAARVVYKRINNVL